MKSLDEKHRNALAKRQRDAERIKPAILITGGLRITSETLTIDQLEDHENRINEQGKPYDWYLIDGLTVEFDEAPELTEKQIMQHSIEAQKRHCGPHNGCGIGAINRRNQPNDL